MTDILMLVLVNAGYAFTWHMIEKVFGRFWAHIFGAVVFFALTVNNALTGHPWWTFIEGVFFGINLYGAWKSRHNRKGKKALQKLGYKALAIRAKIVAAMPKARPLPKFQPNPGMA